MAQTTDAISMANAKVEVSTDGSTYTDISGFAAQVEVSGGDRQAGDSYTYDGDTAIITIGKREPIDITVNVVYTEGSSDPFEAVRAQYEAGSDLYVRWSPKGGSTGDKQYTANGPVTSFAYPAGEAGSGDAVLCQFTVHVASISVSAVA